MDEIEAQLLPVVLGVADTLMLVVDAATQLRSENGSW